MLFLSINQKEVIKDSNVINIVKCKVVFMVWLVQILVLSYKYEKLVFLILAPIS